jgi:hypothetical protein
MLSEFFVEKLRVYRFVLDDEEEEIDKSRRN